MQDCGLIQSLEPFLDAGCGVAIVQQALEALSHMCTASRTRQEAAAVSGVVPHLIRLASPPVPLLPLTPYITTTPHGILLIHPLLSSDSAVGAVEGAAL